MRLLNRTLLEEDYEAILSRNGLIKNGTTFNTIYSSKPIITQSSSGSCNQPLLIPRSHNDISDIIQRFLNGYKKHFGELPKKVAMLGGISHINATSCMEISEVNLQFFDIENFAELIDWQPDVMTCYPSILRTVIAKFGSRLHFLKAIKVGGEKLFPADCENIFALLPNVLLIEQYGSTELPGLAFRSIHKGNFHSEGCHIRIPFQLQKERFIYLNEHGEGWYPFIAKDNFPNLLFNMDAYYDTGDEAFWVHSLPVDFRRKGNVENEHWQLFNRLLKEGFISLQVDIKNQIIFSENSNIELSSYKINNFNFSIVKKEWLTRTKSSNKLQIILPSSL